MTYTLHFELGPDHFTTGGSGHTTQVNVRLGPFGGSLTDFGNFTSDPESGNDGIREWKAFAVDVTSAFNPAVNMEVRFERSGGDDTSHIRRVKVVDNATSDEWLPEYPQGIVYSQAAFDGDVDPSNPQMGQDDDGSSGASMWNMCTETIDSTATHGFNDMRWYFSLDSMPHPCPPAEAGKWSVGIWGEGT